jgi:hypothetical protein
MNRTASAWFSLCYRSCPVRDCENSYS